MVTSNENIPAPNTSYFTPAQVPAAGTAVPPSSGELPKIFQPIRIRGVEFPNRIWVSPMCQYSAQDGIVTPWHFAHLGGIFTRGPGLTITEASAVVPEGRITPHDAGLWNDTQVEAWAKITEFAHSQNQKIGIQIGHAGRKASDVAPWIPDSTLAREDVGGWPNDISAPSSIKYHEKYFQPKELTKEGIKRIVQAFADAAKRAVKAGFDVIEIHNAHGYLLQSFVSPFSNRRTDEYGGSFENRIRLTLEIVDAIRAVIPEDMPLFLRISATDWLEESLPNEPSWRLEDTVRLGPILFERGVDLLDVSSGGNSPSQKINTGPLISFGSPAYQAPFARAVYEDIHSRPSKDGRRLIVATVGAYTNASIAEEALQKEWADVVLVGRLFQKEPGLVFEWADQLGVDVQFPHQIRWGFKGRGRKIQTQERTKQNKKANM